MGRRRFHKATVPKKSPSPSARNQRNHQGSVLEAPSTHTHTHSLSACRGQQHRTKQASGWMLNKAAPMTAFPCTRARQQLAAWSQMCFPTSPGSQPHNLLTPAPSSGHVCVLRPAQGPSPGTAVLLGQLRCHETQLHRSGPRHLAPNKSSSVAGIGHPCSTQLERTL